MKNESVGRELKYKKITTYILKYWRYYVVMLLTMISAIGLNMVTPQITKVVINDVVIGENYNLFPKLILGVLGVGIVRNIFQFWKVYSAEKASMSIGTEMREEVFTHLQGLSMDFFGESNTGVLMARIKDDIDRVWRGIGFIGMLFLEVMIHIIAVLYCMFRLNWKLTFLPLGYMIISGIISVVFQKRLDRVYAEISEKNADLTTVAEENLTGMRTVKAFSREKFEIRKFNKYSDQYYEQNMREAKVRGRYTPFFDLISVLLPVGCALMGGMFVVKGKMDMGSLVAYIAYSCQCTWPMALLGQMIADLAAAMASRKKVTVILERVGSIKEKENPVILPEIKGEIAFSDVSFSVGDKQILSGLNFSIGAGQTLGIMGATGAGKTTIVNLLQRFYDVDEGKITLDGVDIRDLTLHQLRGELAVAMQDVFLFSDTIKENIEMGQRGELSMLEIRRAAEVAQADEFILNMENQYDTVIGERGVGLSGGQRQRISIARTMSKGCPVIILDDTTSALDMETEFQIQKYLNHMKRTTKIIVAHRISSVCRADQILYLEDGRIAEMGTHEELLKKKGLYYCTYCAQTDKAI